MKHSLKYNEGYPKWKHLIPDNPTLDDFKEAWRVIFSFYPHECSVDSITGGRNTGFVVTTPKGVHMHGGFGEHTETPFLITHDFYYEGGCPWYIDEFGERYHKIDKQTLLPHDWPRVKAIETVRRFMVNEVNNIPSLFTTNNIQAL